ncbi:MAG: Re/Si-specific NAD(P)(+) transhydrogenase subunit alpha [Planctomycetota bacterium]
MRLCVPKEIATGERRVALIPDTVDRLVKAGIEVWVEAGAGLQAHLLDRAYEAAGARLEKSTEKLFGEAEVVVKVQRPWQNEALRRHEGDLVRQGAVWIGMIQPHRGLDAVRKLLERNVTSFALEAIPRITRAQSMDVLSSQASVAGYKAVLLAASTLAKFLPMLVTAAGTIAPARVLVLGAGVAGLQAIATARRLGAVVSGFDVRAAVKEQVESLGAAFLAMPMGESAEGGGGYARELSQDTNRKIQDFLLPHVKQMDVVITTAQVPGKTAPQLISEEMVRAMRPGSVIVDLAAESGGNCALTQADTQVEKHDVIILGPTNLPSTMALHASQMFAKNVQSFLANITKDKQLNLDFNDEIVKQSCITHQGQVLHAATKALLEPAMAAGR